MLIDSLQQADNLIEFITSYLDTQQDIDLMEWIIITLSFSSSQYFDMYDTGGKSGIISNFIKVQIFIQSNLIWKLSKLSTLIMSKYILKY